MSTKHVRVTLKCVDGSADDRLPIFIDAKIDTKTREIKSAWMLFGVWGNYKENPDQIFPFVLKEGQLDFGSGAVSEGRFGSTDFLKKKMEKGTLVAFSDWTGENYSYRVHVVARLGKGEV